MRKSAKTNEKTPLRASFRADSDLLPAVRDGLGAVQSADRDCLDVAIRTAFADSLELDEALRRGHDRENRWDYLLGHTSTRALVAVEPHPAKEEEIPTVIKKRAAAIQQLRGHLVDGAGVAKWLWVASGSVFFADTEKTRRRLDMAGVEFVGRRVLARHLEGLPSGGASAESPRGRGSKKQRR